MAMVKVACAKCNRELEGDVVVPDHPATGDRVKLEAYCPRCDEVHGEWVKVFGGPAADMNRAWAAQCRG